MTAEEGLSVIVLTRGRVIEVVPLASSGSLVVGRGARNGLRVADPTASREHARIVWEERRPDPRITLEDLGSANGTRINNAAVRPGTPTDVSPGQPILIGATILIVMRGTARLSPTPLGPTRDIAESQRVTVIRGEMVVDDVE